MKDFHSLHGFPSFAALISRRFPESFISGVMTLVESGYDEACRIDSDVDGELPYRYNEIPHRRNRIIFELVHRHAERCGVSVMALRLDNGYHILELESGGLILHLKHQNPHEGLSEQLTKADYRKQKASVNSLSLQGFLEGFEPDGYFEEPDDCYAVLMFADSSVNKRSAGDIFFALPSPKGDLMAIASLDSVLGEYVRMPYPINENSTNAQSDDIEFPSKRKLDDQDQASS